MCLGKRGSRSFLQAAAAGFNEAEAHVPRKTAGER